MLCNKLKLESTKLAFLLKWCMCSSAQNNHNRFYCLGQSYLHFIVFGVRFSCHFVHAPFFLFFSFNLLVSIYLQKHVCLTGLQYSTLPLLSLSLSSEAPSYSLHKSAYVW